MLGFQSLSGGSLSEIAVIQSLLPVIAGPNGDDSWPEISKRWKAPSESTVEQPYTAETVEIQPVKPVQPTVKQFTVPIEAIQAVPLSVKKVELSAEDFIPYLPPPVVISANEAFDAAIEARNYAVDRQVQALIDKYGQFDSVQLAQETVLAAMELLKARQKAYKKMRQAKQIVSILH